MSTNLLIVESPAKSRTLEKYLGPDFRVMASYGHVRDLVPKEGAVDTEHGFAMKYQVLNDSEKHINNIIRTLKQADRLYLATDPDREGEAISWHLYEILKERKALQGKEVYRVVFHEITKRAVQDAVANPRQLSDSLVNAQQARRALDYLVGFNLSPLLWRKIKGGLSAGRVQSPALRLLCEREAEIEAFVEQEYWTLEAELNKDDIPFTAKLVEAGGRKLEQFDISEEAAAHQLRDQILEQAAGRLRVTRYEQKQRRRNPPPPFITSTLQQDGVNKLGFSSSRTMRTAQQLYEGIDLGSGPVGLITYMRTDSVALASEAIDDLRGCISKHFGADNLPASPRRYKTKSKNAQEAHEAIRPTSAARLPDTVRSRLSDDQFRLYELIWKRTVACQMIHATLDTVSADLSCNGYTFRVSGSTVRNPGFMAVYSESREGSGKKDRGQEQSKLPPLAEKEEVNLKGIVASQHFTEPPPRYSEASLIKTLEEYGIGRPSTYASIISTLQNRDYAVLEKRRFHPTPIGKIISRFLTEHFTQYVDYNFTANLEDALDAISRGEKEWVPVLADFWQPFKNRVDEKDKTVTKQAAAQARELGTDPASGKPVSVRYGRYGPFAQIGSAEDDEKPAFASLRTGQKIETIALGEALELFKLPRELGETPNGEKVLAGIGRFGPYIKYGSKYASLTDDDPHEVSLKRALEVIQVKQEAERQRVIQNFPDAGIQVLKGRYGPYVTDGKKNASVPKGTQPEALTLEECHELIKKAPARKKRATMKKKGSAKKKTAPKKSKRK